jgi:hypothetical protein
VRIRELHWQNNLNKVLPLTTKWQNRLLERSCSVVFLDGIHFKVHRGNSETTIKTIGGELSDIWKIQNLLKDLFEGTVQEILETQDG